jgi:hypothetical protein
MLNLQKALMWGGAVVGGGYFIFINTFYGLEGSLRASKKWEQEQRAMKEQTLALKQ